MRCACNIDFSSIHELLQCVKSYESTFNVKSTQNFDSISSNLNVSNFSKDNFNKRKTTIYSFCKNIGH